MSKLLIIADDFTGALDTGVQFAARGASTQVRMAPAGADAVPATDTEVLVLDVATRHVPPDQAYASVYRAAKAAVKAGIPFLYKKTDSALRGNIGSELSALMDATQTDRLAFVPAYPRMDRVTRNGIHWVEGMPVADGVFGRDPFTPVIRSDIYGLLAAQTNKPIVLHRESDRITCLESPGIHVFDAGSDATLTAIADRLGADALRVSAGCAGFAAELARLLIPQRTPQSVLPDRSNLFVLCGSINPVTRHQIDQATANGFIRFRLGIDQKLDPDWPDSAAGRAMVDRLLVIARIGRSCIVDANDPDGIPETLHWAERHAWPIEQVRQQIAAQLGKLGKRLLEGGLDATLLCTGGDTLQALLRSVDVRTITPLCERSAGVVLASLTLGGRNRFILSKSGGFGPPDLFLNLADQLSAAQHDFDGG
jgi:uncharacterized protein YgbK (DUF1537 family)